MSNIEGQFENTVNTLAVTIRLNQTGANLINGVDSLERGHTLEEFLAGYPTVSREMAIAALEEAQKRLSAKS